MDLLINNANGLYCPIADVYIDPWRPVEKALITHGHSDHARTGHTKYIAHNHSVPILKSRLGKNINIHGVKFGESFSINGVSCTFYPAGHIIGSAQIKLSYKGEDWVVTGDYKIQKDGVCTPFEPVKCHTIITESTFGLPVFQWKPQATVFEQINHWWKTNAENNRTSIICTYSLGKAQRILKYLDPSIGSIYAHDSINKINQVLNEAGIYHNQAKKVVKDLRTFQKDIILTPPNTLKSKWGKQFVNPSIAMASGWMAIQSGRKRFGLETGFVLSDHADWNGLNKAIIASEAERVIVTHGYKKAYAQWLQTEYGLNAQSIDTAFVGESPEI